ncbi:MAG TPA: GYF domain-containing protein [Polyangia bacterium]|nr:GYF domain-containing protein [Polyangia bacterium]
MKIVCDNCATKYSIADEKVRGKVFKIRCKKCSHIIVVRGGADGSVEATSSRDAGPADGGFPGVGAGGEEQQTMAARGGAEPSGDAVWHLVIDREQVGPLSPSEVRAKFAGGEVDAETYAWREGFGDWLRLGSIEDFRDLGGDAPAAPEATRRTDSADLFGGGGGDDAADAPAGDLFGGGAAPAPAYSSAPAPAANEDVFGGGGGGALFSAPSAAPQRQARASSPAFSASSASAESAPSSSHGNGNVVDVRPMTGQRNENSVLFSLNNLQALATGGAGGGKAASSGGGGGENRPGFASSQTEGSGLIDIRAMAASTLAASPSTGGIGSGPGELPGLGAAPVFSPMAAPILMPAAPSGPPKWMWAILGVGVLAVLGIVVVGALLLTRKPAAEPTVAQAPAVAPAAAPVAAAPAAAKPAATPAAPTAAAPAAVAATPSAAPAERHGKAAKGEKPTKLAKNEPAKAPAAPEPAAAPAAAAPAPKHAGGKRDELDDLLNNASPGDTPKQHKAAAAREESSSASDDSLPETLDKSQIVSGMSKVKGRVQGCFDQYKVPGMATVAITIGTSGRVSSANVTGQFAGTPTGDCVAKAVKSAGFSRFKGSPISFVYPYQLR